MFFGATPRGETHPFATRQSGCQDGTDTPTYGKTTLSEELYGILQQGQSCRVLNDALVFGVETSPFGPERLRKCEERRDDAAAVMAFVQHRLDTLSQPMDVLEEDADPESRPVSRNECASSRDEVVLAWIIGACDAVLKAIATLEAYEILAKRACRPSRSQRNGSFSPRSPRSGSLSPRSPEGVLRTTNPPASYTFLFQQASKVRAEAKQRLQCYSGGKRHSALWHWLFDIVCEACTTRQEELEHSARVSDVLSIIYMRASQATRGDVMCCAPADVELDGVRYRALPEEDGRVLSEKVKRGEKVVVKGREGDWISNSNGFLPLKHPIDGSLLFIFDHRKANGADSEDSNGSYDQNKSSSPRLSKQKKATKPNKHHTLQEIFQGNAGRSEEIPK